MENISHATNIHITFERVSLPVLILMRTSSSAIVFLNGFVFGCLVFQNQTFSPVYRLQLACLSFNDLIAGIALLSISYLDSSTFTDNFGFCCVVLCFFLSSQCATLYNILSICISRLIKIRKLSRSGQVWKNTHTLVGLGLAWIVSIVLCSVPFALWSVNKEDFQYIGCSMETVFQDNFPSSMKMLMAGFILPLMFTDILYGVAFSLLKKTFARTSPENQEHIARTYHREGHARYMSATNSIEVSHITSTSHGDRTTAMHNPLPKQAWGSMSSKTQNNSGIGNSGQGTEQGNATGTSNSLIPGSQNSNVSSPIILHQTRRQASRAYQQRKTFIVLCLLLIFLNVFTLPSIVVLFTQGLVDTFTMTRGVKFPLFSVITVNSIINPFLYAVKLPEFRASLKTSGLAIYNKVLCKRT